jgi:hypothetical protein
MSTSDANQSAAHDAITLHAAATRDAKSLAVFAASRTYPRPATSEGRPKLIVDSTPAIRYGQVRKMHSFMTRQMNQNPATDRSRVAQSLRSLRVREPEMIARQWNWEYCNKK